MRYSLLALPVLLAACGTERVSAADTPLELIIESPSYGQFLGDGPIRVTGQVSDPGANLQIGGQPVQVDGAGRFAVLVDFDGDYEVVDIQLGRQAGPALRERIPVFAGQDPMESFVAEIPARVTNDGLERLGVELGRAFDETGWSEQIANALPSWSGSDLSLSAKGVEHEPTRVEIQGAEGGLDVGLAIRDFRIVYEARASIFGGTIEADLEIGYDRVGAAALAQPAIRDDGVVFLRASNTSVDLTDARVSIGDIHVEVAEAALDGLGWVVTWLGENLGDVLFDLIDEVEIGGPFDFETDLMGTELSLALRQVAGEPQGLTLGATVGIDQPAPHRGLNTPYPLGSDRVSEPVHLAVGVHEGLLHSMVGGAISEALSEDLDLGPIGGVLGTVVGNLPGGEYAPDGATWCFDLAPGPATLVRLRDGIDPLGSLFLPDIDLTIGTLEQGVCDPWIISNIAIDANIVAQGSTLRVNLGIGDGAVMYYGAPSHVWREEEVVDSLSSLIDSVAGILGGQLTFDLAELIGGLSGEGFIGEVEPKILDSQPMSFDAKPIDGMYALSLSLWGELDE
ncbi:MAG: hypothetical protein EA397_04400 [Deltaproteobacteria bacterium]|nr:MAG: hypothetical protein EA397_04400 [Deltaproteobacteria bacterium]